MGPAPQRERQETGGANRHLLNRRRQPAPPQQEAPTGTSSTGGANLHLLNRRRQPAPPQQEAQVRRDQRRSSPLLKTSDPDFLAAIETLKRHEEQPSDHHPEDTPPPRGYTTTQRIHHHPEQPLILTVKALGDDTWEQSLAQVPSSQYRVTPCNRDNRGAAVSTPSEHRGRRVISR